MSFAITVFLGVLAGTHAATWGAYKDAPFEGFRPDSYVRSVLLAAVIAGSAYWWPGSGIGRSSVVITVGMLYSLERLATEFWKTIVRTDDQSAYTIPMRFAVGGKPVDHTGIRYGVGAAVIVGIAGATASVTWLQQAFPLEPAWLLVPTVGAAGGWATAVGGAWKDAPIEGFSGWKFVRSPVVAAAWAVPLSLLTSSWVVLLIASGGFAVASIETYKTFFTGDRPPGKFADRPVRHALPALRRRLGRLHATLWAALGVGLVESLSQPANGLSTSMLSAVAEQLPTLVLGAVASCAAVFALLVFDRNARLVGLGA